MRSALIVVVVVLWAAITAHRVMVWTDERALWADAARKAPEKPRPWINLGNQYLHLGADSLAAITYQHAKGLALASGRSRSERIVGGALADVNLGIVRLRQGRRSEGLSLIRQTAERLPTNAEVQAVWRRVGSSAP